MIVAVYQAKTPVTELLGDEKAPQALPEVENGRTFPGY